MEEKKSSGVMGAMVAGNSKNGLVFLSKKSCFYILNGHNTIASVERKVFSQVSRRTSNLTHPRCFVACHYAPNAHSVLTVRA